MIQIENKEAVENVEEIASVEGIGKRFKPLPCNMNNWAADALFIGPYDLSISLGYPPPSPDPHPDVEQVIQKVLRAAHASQKKWYVVLRSRKSGLFIRCSTVPFSVYLGLKPPSAQKRVLIWSEAPLCLKPEKLTPQCFRST